MVVSPGSEEVSVPIVDRVTVAGRFGLKEVPTIPEPATAVLLGIGGALLTFTRRREHASVDRNKRNLRS